MARKTKVQKLKEQIMEIQAEINQIRATCKHKNVDVKHCGSTGGYEPDTYWTEYTCKACGKFWTEPKI